MGFNSAFKGLIRSELQQQTHNYNGNSLAFSRDKFGHNVVKRQNMS